MITEIIYNWFYTTVCGDEYNRYELGKSYTLGKVKKIEKHFPAGEGDRHYCIVYFENGSTEIIYNVNKITEIEQGRK